MHILTNFERFPESWSVETGESGTAEIVRDPRAFAEAARRSDFILINCSIPLVLRLCAEFIAFPARRKPIVAVDLVLRKPGSARARISSLVKRLLFSRVSLFVHYFKDLAGYERYFGIDARRSVYVPFKPNLRHKVEVAPDSDGDYILCFGRSMRDYDTFFDAVGTLPYPAAIPSPNFAQFRAHQSRFTRTLDRLPKTVVVLEDDGSQESLVRILSRARLVVLPILASSLAASGIGTYLNSMLIRKCVIISAGIGTSDVLTEGQALLVAPEDPTALAGTIRRAWEDDELRERTADAGYRYASSLGGEPELRQRILEEVFRHPRIRAELARSR